MWYAHLYKVLEDCDIDENNIRCEGKGTIEDVLHPKSKIDAVSKIKNEQLINSCF